MDVKNTETDMKFVSVPCSLCLYKSIHSSLFYIDNADHDGHTGRNLYQKNYSIDVSNLELPMNILMLPTLSSSYSDSITEDLFPPNIALLLKTLMYICYCAQKTIIIEQNFKFLMLIKENAYIN